MIFHEYGGETGFLSNYVLYFIFRSFCIQISLFHIFGFAISERLNMSVFLRLSFQYLQRVTPHYSPHISVLTISPLTQTL